MLNAGEYVGGSKLSINIHAHKIGVAIQQQKKQHTNQIDIVHCLKSKKSNKFRLTF